MGTATMRARFRLAVVVGLTLASTAFTVGPAQAYRFSSEGVDDVLSAASTYASRCGGLTRNELAAMVLAPTWAESVGGSSSATPAPMTLSRSDTANPLYSYNDPSSLNKAFWHPGVGCVAARLVRAGSELRRLPPGEHLHVQPRGRQRDLSPVLRRGR